jgi:hypothetical protein
VRRFVLAPVLAVEAVVFAVLVALSLAAAVDEDPTALAYGAIFAVLGMLATLIAGALLGRRDAWDALPAWCRRVGLALFALAAAGAALISAGLSVFALEFATQHPDPYVEDGDPCCTYPDTWGEIAAAGAVGVALVAGAVGLTCAAALAACHAVMTGPGPRPRTQAVAATGVAVALAFVAALVLNVVVAGEYP